MRRVLLAAVVAAAALSISTCGLENLAYLLPPVSPADPASLTNPVFTVENPLRDAAEVLVFRGFELYYKFFSSDQSSLRDAQSGLVTTREQLISTYGFSRMCTEGKLTQVLPFIPVDPADRGDDTLEAVLDFNLSSSSSTPTMSYTGSVPLVGRYGTIRRSVTDLSGEPKTFAFDKMDSGDADLAGINWVLFSTDGILDLVVYAISYGVQDYSHVYSASTPLGFMEYHF
jgi:hypothetical protein